MTDYFLADAYLPTGEDNDDISLDQFAGGSAFGKPIWDKDVIAAYLNRTGGGWGTGPNELMPRGGNADVITYGFHENQQSLLDNGYFVSGPINNYASQAFAEYFNFAPFNEAQRAATRQAISYWDDVLAVTFRETSAYEGDINYANLANAPATQAYSRIPTAGYGTSFGGLYGPPGAIAGYAADVWVSASQASNFRFAPGQYGLNTLVHETGHSLGLSHPGQYNFGPGFAVTYQNGAEYAQDIRNYAIMSYWNPRDVGIQDHDFNIGTITYGATPSMHDIYATQKMYGADMTTRTGDTTYGFNATADLAGRNAFNFDINKAPTVTIWDAGGIDTLDASKYSTNQLIDLTPGSMSSIGGVTQAELLTIDQINVNRAAVGLGPMTQAGIDFHNAKVAGFATNPNAGLLVDNVGIAYGVTIENAVGGKGNDTIIGNSASNKISGGAGNDVISGGAGIDYVTGGAGADTFIADINGATFVAKKGPIALDVITDFVSGVDKIDLRGIDANAGAADDQAFTFNGTAANKTAGMLTYKVYDSVNGAEKALGIEIDGLPGKGANVPVTVVFGNVDGGDPDFGLVLIGTSSVVGTDFHL